ncbi:hypothetical protein ACQ4PT_011472 [Festuca glaucescens]
MVRLDRILFNDGWDCAFPSCMLQALSSELSDHCPLLLSSNAGFKPVRRFRFEFFWVSREDFVETVQAAWDSCPSKNNPFVKLHCKLTATARALRRWSANFTSDMALRAAITSELIFRLDQAMDRRALTPQEMQFRAMLKMNCLGIAAAQRSMWRQRSRICWLRDGDASTRFFHAKANSRRRKSFIHKLELDGVTYTEQHDKEEQILNFFDKLIGSKRDGAHSLNFELLGLDTLDLSELEAPFSEAEVKAAMTDINSDKAPGPDGFTPLFFKKAWVIVAPDIMRAIHALERCCSDRLDLLNSATMILLPKRSKALHPKDFRPISLVGFFAKLATKILALRLQPRMHELISPC